MYTGMLLADVAITQDHCQVTLGAGTVLMLASGGALEASIGLGNIANVSGLDQDVPALASGASN